MSDDDRSNPEVEALFEDDPGEGLVGDEDDDLKLDNADTKVWLVKVPKFLFERWNTIDEDNINLGSVRIYTKPPKGQTSTISLVLPESSREDKIPLEYSINVPPEEVRNKFVFTEDNNGMKAIGGKVHHECAATPTQLEPYRGIMRKRVLDAGTPQRTVQVLGQNNQPVFVPGASGSMNNTFADFIPSKRAKTDNKEKATRMPRNELMDLLFSCFERYPYWSFRGLIAETKQPSQYLKEVLTDICILNKKGPYAGNYQIKPEYKQRPSEAEKKQAADQEPTDDEDDEDDDEVMEHIAV
jgi:transcription initiation factor TFIIF subunit beta